MNTDKLLIIGNSLIDTSNFQKINESADKVIYKFKGKFTPLNVLNDNNRLYTPDNVCPLIEKLQPKIKQRKLLGELDHPADFDIKYSRVSHVIDSLYYDKTDNCIYGEFTLLNTQKGKDAQAIVDAGIPLHVSSRASGEMLSNNCVKLNNIITYDLVPVAGFGDLAEQKRIYESLDADSPLFNILNGMFKEQERLHDNLELITESGDASNNIKVYKIKDKNKSIPMAGVTLQELKEWSNEFETRVNKAIDEKIAAITSKDSDTNNELQKIKSALLEWDKSNIANFNKLLKDSSTNNKAIEHIVEYIDSFKESIDDRLNILQNYIETISEQSNKLASIVHENGLAGNILAEYVESINNSCIKLASIVHENGLAGNILAEYVESISEQSNKLASIVHENGLAGNILAEYTESINEKITALAKQTDSISEISNKLLSGTSIAESLNSQRIDEQFNLETTGNYKNDISNKINNILAKVNESYKRNSILPNSPELAFLQLVDKQTREEFFDMDIKKKSFLIKKMNENKYYTHSDVSQIWNSANAEWEAKKNLPMWLENAPTWIKDEYLQLDESLKLEINKQANHYNLENSEKVTNFWKNAKYSTINKLITENKSYTAAKNSVSHVNTPTSINEDQLLREMSIYRR